MGDAALSGLSRQERLELLRSRIAAVPARGEAKNLRIPLGAEEESTQVLQVPGALADLLPFGGLVRGSVVSIAGASSLLVGLLASVTAGGGHAVVIGRPRLGLLAACEMGAQLGRIALVPDPGPDPVEVAAVLLDGMDLVVLGLGGATVSPTRARAVVARARSKGCTLVVADGQWSGAELRLDARVVGYGGLGRGSGRLRSLQLAVRAQGRAFGPAIARLDVQQVDGRIEWVTPVARPAIVQLPEAVSI
ncbi:hypothetical protein [Antrihabitans sp. YC2-6]|uniref:hypothetical protein n=1 Tax=Antrihabitans sp. YC2-6 TaxID=2799498 RepID=UPI0018F5860E|nr:hypothetical protein [Antrihabitans sp. YC2-6]MBJ8347412.1 hypothetical protein [Antrihabitans sp. YC2-6]